MAPGSPRREAGSEPSGKDRQRGRLQRWCLSSNSFLLGCPRAAPPAPGPPAPQTALSIPLSSFPSVPGRSPLQTLSVPTCPSATAPSRPLARKNGCYRWPRACAGAPPPATPAQAHHNPPTASAPPPAPAQAHHTPPPPGQRTTPDTLPRRGTHTPPPHAGTNPHNTHTPARRRTTPLAQAHHRHTRAQRGACGFPYRRLHGDRVGWAASIVGLLLSAAGLASAPVGGGAAGETGRVRPAR